jgi:thiol-disulfide isomerase/thioredoxin
MVQKTSAVTPERYSKGVPYAEFIAAIDRNQSRFQENYDGTQIAAEDIAALKALMAKPNGPAKMLVLGEAWCPDVFRGAPVFARIAEATGMETRFFFRDQNKDIMAEFLNNGEHESIPVAVFYTKDLDYIAHWIERPALANKQTREDLAPMYERFRKPDPTPEERAQIKEEYVAFQNGPIWAGWRQETVREVIALLREKLD